MKSPASLTLIEFILEMSLETNDASYYSLTQCCRPTQSLPYNVLAYPIYHVI